LNTDSYTLKHNLKLKNKILPYVTQANIFVI